MKKRPRTLHQPPREIREAEGMPASSRRKAFNRHIKGSEHTWTKEDAAWLKSLAALHRGTGRG